MNPATIKGMRPADEVMSALTARQGVRGREERRRLLVYFLFPHFSFLKKKAVAFEGVDVTRRCVPVQQQRGTGRGSSAPRGPPQGLRGAPVCTPVAPDQAAMALEFHFAQWAPPSLLRRLLTGAHADPRATGPSPCELGT